jgi:putative drug exporter of the RND superfamily
MKNLLQLVTDWVSTKRGMWITLAVWLVVTVTLALFAPNVKDYEVSRIASLPEDAPSVIAQQKMDEYFKDSTGTPGILVFQAKTGNLESATLVNIHEQIMKADIPGVEQVIPLASLPPQAIQGFFSEDGTTALIPIIFNASLETKEVQESKDQILEVVKAQSDVELYITGPAGIATDSLDLFSRADLVLIFSTIGLILILLIVIYRSPLLAIIPLLAAVFVYEVVMQLLGIFAKAGLAISNQTISIMSILLFAAVIDYSLFVFSRFREELKNHESKFVAMKEAMRETGMPVFFSGGTVLAAMLVLFFAELGDYRSFAPTFATTLVVIMLASVTLVPALFTLFGRKSFWPKVPKIGSDKSKDSSFWGKTGKWVVRKPGLAVAIISVILLLSAANMFNLRYEFDTIKSFPADMPSRIGYEIIEEKFNKGDLAPTTALFEAKESLSQDEQEALRTQLQQEPLVSNVQLNETADNDRVLSYTLTFKEGPYDIETIDALEKMVNRTKDIVAEANLDGDLYFAGETANRVDDRQANNKDIYVIVLLETLLIFVMLIFLTKSVKMPIYMMGTILLSFLAALGLGMFLSDLIFGIDTISNRVPLYAFVFLVALGIDYNIILISRFQEERRRHPVKKAVEIAVANTGGVISSAGIILAATFAVLMTQPLQLLFVFGFIVAVGILLDTFLIRGILLPGLIVLIEKEKATEENI